jgi:5-carboxymethyl-2-hydroxymuconate isomerase
MSQMATVFLDPGNPFSVSKIVCVGRNYARHIAEMSSERMEEPVLFLKPPTAILNIGLPIVLPSYSSDVHHEVELALLISRKTRRIKKEDWHLHVAGIGVALDLTLRDYQLKAKEKGLPWSVSKGFDGSCPISTFYPLDHIEDIQNLNLKLSVNGQIRQDASTANMLFPVSELIAYISRIFTLEQGDLVLTGTPEGVGPLKPGDSVVAELAEIAHIQFDVIGEST